MRVSLHQGLSVKGESDCKDKVDSVVRMTRHSRTPPLMVPSHHAAGSRYEGRGVFVVK